MRNIANLLFKAKILKEIPRSGYHYLGAGKESVAEHSFSISFIAFVMSQMEPNIDALKLITMCLVQKATRKNQQIWLYFTTKSGTGFFTTIKLQPDNQDRSGNPPRKGVSESS